MVNMERQKWLTADGLQLTARKNDERGTVNEERISRANEVSVHELYGLTEEEIGIIEGEE
jgi:hypothetical protein